MELLEVKLIQKLCTIRPCELVSVRNPFCYPPITTTDVNRQFMVRNSAVANMSASGNALVVEAHGCFLQEFPIDGGVALAHYEKERPSIARDALAEKYSPIAGSA